MMTPLDSRDSNECDQNDDCSRSDQQLLDRFVARRDQSAFTELVRRNIGMVHAAARRQVHDPHLAADITQAVFIVLARKAPTLGTNTNLQAWLFAVTRHAVANARRVQARQRLHEANMAMMLRESSAPPADVNAELADEFRSVLDDGIARLSHVERVSVLMHFFGNKTHREIGQEIGATEDATRKRIARSLEKLRTILMHHRGGAGITSGAATTTTTSLALASVMRAEAAVGASIAGQPQLVASIANVAVLANALSNGGGASSIAQGVLRTLGRVSRVRMALAASIIVVLMVGVTSILAYTRRTPPPPRLAPVPALAIRFGKLTNVEFIGASTYPPAGDSWCAANGSSIPLPDERLLDVHLPTAVPPQFEVAVRVTHPTSEVMRLHVVGSNAGSNMSYRDGEAIVIVAVFSFSAPPDAATLELAIADGPWTTIATNPSPTQSFDKNEISFEPIATADGAATIVVRHPRIDGQHQLVAVDYDGGSHVATSMSVTMLGPNLASKCSFDVPAGAIASVALQTRPFSRVVEFEEVSLNAGQPTNPIIKLRAK